MLSEMLKQSQVIRQHHWSSSLLRQLSMRLQESIEDLLVNISQTVSRLIGPSAESKGVRTTKELFSESTGNAYTFVGNLKRPIDTIQWLCPKAAISPGGSGSVSSPAKIYGFLFFENLDGYVFKSVDTLLKQPTAVRYRKERSQVKVLSVF